MTVLELAHKCGFDIAAPGDAPDREVGGVFCCDLHSLAMSGAKPGDAWVTVMGNVNTVAVAVLTDAACAVVAHGVKPDETALQKAAQQGVCILCSGRPVFETALAIYNCLT